MVFKVNLQKVIAALFFAHRRGSWTEQWLEKGCIHGTGTMNGPGRNRQQQDAKQDVKGTRERRWKHQQQS